MMFDKNRIDECFPKETYRVGQRECIEYAIDNFNSGKNIVVLECPTGSGKSAIAMTLAKMANSSFYLTSSKQLQDQLAADYNKDIVSLKGRNAYPCTYWTRKYKNITDGKLMSKHDLDKLIISAPNCDNGYCKTGIRGDGSSTKASCDQCFATSGPMPGKLSVLPPDTKYSTCPYFEKLYEAVHSPRVVMNFHNYIAQLSNGRFNKRELLIIDEAHNQESILMDFVSCTLSDARLNKHGITIPEYDDIDDYIKWLCDSDIINSLTKVANILSSSVSNIDRDFLDSVNTNIKNLSNMLNKIEAGDEWIAQFERVGNHNKVMFKPIFIRRYAHEILYNNATKVLMLSATILDGNVFCNSLGIDRAHAALKRIPNMFPVENRLIQYQPVGKLTGGKDKSSIWMPKVINKVNELVRKYKGKRGIIHTHNFAISKELFEKCALDVRTRFLDQNSFNDKTDMLNHHAECTDTVIVAPAMHEGLDLKDDLSRFQIITKIPFPNFYSDKQLSRRKDVDPQYYNWLTALKLVQSIGRSVRSDTDYADTYIIDESFENLMKFNGAMFPKWFKESIRGL